MKNKKTVWMQWGIPFVFLLIIIIVILIHFSLTGRTKSMERVMGKAESDAEIYAQRLYDELNLMTQTGLPVADVLGSIQDGNTQIIQELQSSVCNNTVAYQVVYTNTRGYGRDQEGNAVDLSGEPYFRDFYKEQTYEYVEKDGVSNRSAVVSIIPVNGNHGGALYLYYPMERLEELFKNVTYVPNSFCVLMVEQGKIVESVGGNPEVENAVESAWANMREYIEQHFTVKRQDGTILMTYAPITIHDWYVMVGTDYSRIKLLVERDWKPTREIVGQLLISIMAFILFVIGVSVVNKMKYNRQNKSLEIKADTDLLTELYNKIATEREIKKYIQENPDQKGLFFLVDIDNFKKINDTMGHAFGDEVLRTIGNRLKVEFRQSDIIGRIGGDEMIIFLKNIQDDAIMERQIKKVDQFYKTLEIGEYVKYKVTASIGVSVFPKQGRDFAALYAQADKALYIAKGKGKNCIYHADWDANS
ncbi:MAG: sensor domain-containing diguanylate cyclase [Lachnospiraceae bacterium]|nr:sensor domain-containing diguanylate cyclase [Lachnospiraceae bacterium]